MRTKDGRKVWVSDVSYPWTDNEGKVIGSMGCLRDITERVEAERQSRESLARIIDTDMLTGWPNRRVFFARLNEEIKRLSRNAGELSVMLVDIDHFRKVNERAGYETGDFVLRELTGLINSCLRETDSIARIGGEEFGIILPDTSADGAYWVAERIRTTVAAYLFDMGEGAPMQCTVSLGISGCSVDEVKDAGALFQAADAQMMLAKQRGCNLVAMQQAPSGSAVSLH